MLTSRDILVGLPFNVGMSESEFVQEVLFLCAMIPFLLCVVLFRRFSLYCSPCTTDFVVQGKWTRISHCPRFHGCCLLLHLSFFATCLIISPNESTIRNYRRYQRLYLHFC